MGYNCIPLCKSLSSKVFNRQVENSFTKLNINEYSEVPGSNLKCSTFKLGRCILSNSNAPKAISSKFNSKISRFVKD